MFFHSTVLISIKEFYKNSDVKKGGLLFNTNVTRKSNLGNVNDFQDFSPNICTTFEQVAGSHFSSWMLIHHLSSFSNGLFTE
jgi:hypothetical protein